MKQEEQILLEIGTRIRAIREALKLTQRELAQQLGISGPSLSEFETGKHSPNFEFIYNIHRKFNIDLYYLLYGEGEMFDEPGGPLIKRLEKLSRESADVKRLLSYFARSTVIRYFLLGQFGSKMLAEGPHIDREIFEKKEDQREVPFPE